LVMSQGGGEEKIQSPFTDHQSHDHESICRTFRTNVPTLCREFNGVFVPKNANGLLELLGVERFL
jgi:hypothetical protein